jgi:hypothetical protein
MNTRIHFEVLNLSKMVLNHKNNFVEWCTINFIMQTAVMGTKYRPGFHFIFDLRINLKIIVRYPRGEPYATERTNGVLYERSSDPTRPHPMPHPPNAYKPLPPPRSPLGSRKKMFLPRCYPFLRFPGRA